MYSSWLNMNCDRYYKTIVRAHTLVVSASTTSHDLQSNPHARNASGRQIHQHLTHTHYVQSLNAYNMPALMWIGERWAFAYACRHLNTHTHSHGQIETRSLWRCLSGNITLYGTYTLYRRAHITHQRVVMGSDAHADTTQTRELANVPRVYTTLICPFPFRCATAERQWVLEPHRMHIVPMIYHIL